MFWDIFFLGGGGGEELVVQDRRERGTLSQREIKIISARACLIQHAMK